MQPNVPADELFFDVPPPLSMAEELAYQRIELVDLQRMFADGTLGDDGKAFGRTMIASVEARIRDLEALARGEARPDAVVDC